MCKTTIQLLKYYSEPIVTSLHPYIKPQPGTLCRVNTGSTATSDYLLCLVSYLAFDYMHETRHQLRTLQEEVEVVKDDFWIPIQPVKRKGDKNANQRKEDAESISFLSFLYVKRLMLGEGCIDSPGYEALKNVVVLADELDEARGRHSV